MNFYQSIKFNLFYIMIFKIYHRQVMVQKHQGFLSLYTLPAPEKSSSEYTELPGDDKNIRAKKQNK